MTKHHSQLINYVEKFIGTIRFGNDQVASIIGYGDYHIGNVTISRVYYVDGLGHSLFLTGQISDSDLEVAFQKHSCFVPNLAGVDILKGSKGINLYTLSLEDMLKSSPICLLSKASKTKSWLWHCCLSHLNFGIINQLAKEGLVRGLPKLKYEKYHLCSACSLGKSKKHTHKPISENSFQEKLHLNICTDNGIEFVNQTLKSYYEDVKITHQTSVARTPQQNNVVERQNYTLVEPLPSVAYLVPPTAASIPADTTSTPSLTTIDQDAPSGSTSPTTEETQAAIIHQGVKEQLQGI
uniref:Integrase, catalytic region, zinc finger, CCHC-type, peptidase aspartic, catalytic n=1 Tax=Tanacetum cinerariifolium TaxID=118510 RepID=A0A6L2KX94_TANCI|nr:integrase, catalytic region, zinc finger, CCHC-type, peptidase aspartic, catalytic [Tanacetum cinerariifolium]